MEQVQEALFSYLQKELSLLGCSHEAKWIAEELVEDNSLKDFDSKKVAAQIIVERRKTGEPLAYILGHWDFRNLKLKVGPGVLIPRPETEELVGHALAHLENAMRITPGKLLRVADLGAGSGAIAFAIADEANFPLEIFAVEKSPEAFTWLQKNIPSSSKSKIHLIQSDWENANLSEIDLIVSNPPYIPEVEMNTLSRDVLQFEPHVALMPLDKENVFAAYDSLMRLSEQILAPNGALLCEFGSAQKDWESHISHSFKSWKTFKDLSGKERILYSFDFQAKSR